MYDLLPPDLRKRWVFPVGRLDMDSEGLIIVTNDGPLCFRLTDPKHRIEKTYRVLLNRLPADEAVDELRRGADLGDYVARPAVVEHEEGWWFRVTITEGRYRQIRKMFRTARCRVRRLIRVAVGPVTLGDLAPGETRPLTDGERRALKARSKPHFPQIR